MSIKKQLAALSEERGSHWKNIYVQRLPEVMKLPELSLLGSYSFSLLETRRRVVRGWIEIEPGIRETPSAIARDYLRLVYKRGPRGTRKQLDTSEVIPPVPNVALPQKFAHGKYVDIHACYWSIMQIVGWNVDYYPGLWLSPGRPPADYPFPEHKVGRNCLVSSGRMTGIPRFNPRKLPGDPFDEIRPGNILVNTQLPRLIHDVLNSIMSECVEAGAIYANNDGLIAPTPGIAATCQGIIEDWGLETTIKGEGAGSVKSSGAYAVGAVRSLPWGMRNDTQPIMAVWPPVYAKWLRRQFSALAGRGQDV